MSDVQQQATETSAPFAVVKIQGKQYRVKVGERLVVDQVNDAKGEAIEPGSEVTFEEVLLSAPSADRVTVGLPLVAGASVKAKVVRHLRAKKVLIFKKFRRTGYTKKQGHRQDQTELTITAIQ